MSTPLRGLLTLAALAAMAGCGGGSGDTETVGSTTAAAAAETGAQARVGGRIGDQAPDFQLKSLDGQAVSLSALRGNVVIIDFWATWCGPCRMVMPHLEEIHRAYGDKGVTILAVATDRDGPKVVPEFIKKNGYTFSVAYADEQIQQAFGGVRNIPTTFVIDPEGKVAHKLIGAHPKAVYLAEIRKLKPELFTES